MSKCRNPIPDLRLSGLTNSNAPVTFFYPSTEWAMDQPFNCNCGTKVGYSFRYLISILMAYFYLDMPWLDPRCTISVKAGPSRTWFHQSLDLGIGCRTRFIVDREGDEPALAVKTSGFWGLLLLHSMGGDKKVSMCP